MNNIIWLLGFVGLVGSNLPKVGRKSGFPRGEFAQATQDSISSNLIQGDLAVPVSHIGADEDALDSFVTDQKALWMKGIVHYRIEEDEYEGVVEPVFTDAQIANITARRGALHRIQVLL